MSDQQDLLAQPEAGNALEQREAMLLVEPVRRLVEQHERKGTEALHECEPKREPEQQAMTTALRERRGHRLPRLPGRDQYLVARRIDRDVDDLVLDAERLVDRQRAGR